MIEGCQGKMSGVKTNDKSLSINNGFDQLPDVIIMSILRLFDQHDILQMMLVSKYIRNLVLSTSSLFLNPKLENGDKLESMIAFYKRYFPHLILRKLDLSVHLNEKEAVRQFLESQIQVTDLTLRGYSLSNKAVIEILDSSPTARKLFKKLKSFTFEGTIADNNQGFLDFFPYFGEIEAFTGHAMMFISNYYDREVSSSAILSIPSLKSLDIYSMDSEDPSLSSSIILGPLLNNAKFENLKNLSIGGCYLESNDLVNILNPHIETLELSEIPEEAHLDFVNVASVLCDVGCRLKKFNYEVGDFDMTMYNPYDIDGIELTFLSQTEDLTIAQSRLSSSSLNRILEATRGNLKSLHLESNLPMIFSKDDDDPIPADPVSFNEIVSLCPRLQSLSLSHCTNFNDHSLHELSNAILANVAWTHLTELNLSYNDISANGLYKLFERYPTLRVKLLTVDGIHVNPSSLDPLKKEGYCKEVSCDIPGEAILMKTK